MTQKEWDDEFMRRFDRHWIESSAKNTMKIMNDTREEMVARYGPRPSGEPGPPWWLKLTALPVGVNMTKLWEWLNGKKTIIGALITVLATVAGVLPTILAAIGVEAVLIGKVVGIATMVVGVAHKIYKFLYKEEHP